MRMNDKTKCNMNDSMSVYTRQVEFRCISPEIIQMVKHEKLYPTMNFAKEIVAMK